VDGGGDVVAGDAGGVAPGDIRDGKAALVAAVGRVDAGRHVDGLVDGLDVDVLEGDVAHVALARVRLDPGRVAAVDAGDVLEVDVVDELGRPVLAHAADARAPGLAAHHVADVDVGGVALHGDAVLQERRISPTKIPATQETTPRSRPEKLCSVTLTSPHRTVQFEMVTSLEFHVSVPSVLTALYCDVLNVSMSKLVIVTF